VNIHARLAVAVKAEHIRITAVIIETLMHWRG